MINLKPEHFEAYSDRCLRQGSGERKRPHKPGTVKHNLTALERVIDFGKRQLGLIINPVNAEDVKRPAVNDERDMRLTPEEQQRLLDACYAA